MRKILSMRLLFAILLAIPLNAQFVPGTVYIENRSANSSLGLTGSDLWVYTAGASFATATGTPLIYQPSPLGAGHFLIPNTNTAIFERGRTVSTWDGGERFYNDPDTGIHDIFTSDADLGEIAPARFGHFLVPAGTKLIEFTPAGVVAEYNLPLAATHIDLLSDACTVLYTLGHADPNPGRVHRFNICTGA